VHSKPTKKYEDVARIVLDTVRLKLSLIRIFKIKYKSNGEIKRYKARLVAKGFNQREGIDFHEIFSLVVKMSTVRCLIALSVKNKRPLFQLDVSNVFLYGDLEENVYMTNAQGFFDKGKKNKVWKPYSHAHLFFQCSYSSIVWSMVLKEVDFPNVSPIWNDVLDWLLHILKSNQVQEEYAVTKLIQTWKISCGNTNSRHEIFFMIFKIKYKSNGEIKRYKARLVAKGFNQREGIDFHEIFSLVVKMSTVRCLIALSVKNKRPLFQLDVSNVFLYGDLEENVYMTNAQGFFDKGKKNKVCKLVKSLYGLK
nr:ribonuclease H-like domain-containing protein [Tanacetum cinerariifolium]